MQHNYLRRSLLITLVTLLTLPLLFAATIRVTSTADSGPGSLRDAVASAAAGDTIMFTSAVIYKTINLSSEIVIDKALRIRGNGWPTNTIDGGGKTRAFNVTTSDDVYIGALTISNCNSTESGGAILNTSGQLFLDGMRITDSNAGGTGVGNGGGAVASGGRLLVAASQFMNNSATGETGNGGAILSTGGGFAIVGTTFTGNSSNRAGGAIEISGDASGSTLTRVTMTGNTTGGAPGNGGGVHITGASSLQVNGGTYSNNNAAREGGALWNGTGTMTIRGATIDNNTATGPAADDGGGGIFNNGGTLRIFSGTSITNNAAEGAAGSGGGIFNNTGGVVRIIRATITGNTANRAGGGIEDNSGGGTPMRISLATIDNNETFTSPGNGGGIHITGGGNLTVFGGTVNGNIAGAEGGGIWNGTGNTVLFAATVNNNEAKGDDADQGGGGLFNNSGGGNISVRFSTIDGNTATGASGSGGGILIDEGSSLNLLRATVTNNTANRAGGGIEDASGPGQGTVITRSDIDGNTVFNAPGNGGGIHVGGAGDISFRSGNVRNNTAGSEGGGIWIGSGILSIGQGVAFENNTAGGDDADQGGGALYTAGAGTINIRNNVTFTGNSATGASGSGGAILINEGATLTMDRAIFTGNIANRAGGAIEDNSGAADGFNDFRVINSTFTSNVVNNSPGNGGAIHITGLGNAMIRGGEFNSNTAGSEGGAVWNSLGTMRVSGTMFVNNAASGAEASNGGGALFNNGGTMRIDGITAIDNRADGASGSGGALLTVGGNVSITGSSLTDNMSSRAGGAVEQIDGSFLSANTDYRGNSTGSAPGNGGAFHVTGMASQITFQGGKVENNVAASEGGGLWNQSGSTMQVANVTFTNNVANGAEASNGGGALFNNGGDLVVTDASFTTNSADGASGSGGALLTTGGDVMVDNSTFTSNTSSRAGGAVEQIDGSFTSTDNIYVLNSTGSAPGNGGAFHVTGMNSTVSFTGGSFTGNTAANEGGALWNQSGTTMTVDGASISGNSVTGNEDSDSGGGIFNNSGITQVMNSVIVSNSTSGGGGGIFNKVGGDFLLMTSTVSGNDAGAGGGGIHNAAAFTLTNSTVAFNTAASGGGYFQDEDMASLTITGTILSDNDATGDMGEDISAAGGTVTSNGYNLIAQDDLNQFDATANDLEGGDADLEVLTDNGGPTRTHALGCDSDAIDAGDPADASPDQRGEGLVGTRDIGAFERQDACPAGLTAPDVTAAANFLDLGVSVYPNPTSGDVVNVMVPIGIEGQTTLRIMDTDGRLRSTLSTRAGGSVRVPVAELPNGTYFLQVVDGETSTSRRIVINR